MEAIKLRASIGFGNLGYYYCQCQGSAFCKIDHSGEYYPKAEADAELDSMFKTIKEQAQEIGLLKAEIAKLTKMLLEGVAQNIGWREER